MKEKIVQVELRECRLWEGASPAPDLDPSLAPDLDPSSAGAESHCGVVAEMLVVGWDSQLTTDNIFAGMRRSVDACPT